MLIDAQIPSRKTCPPKKTPAHPGQGAAADALFSET